MTALAWGTTGQRFYEAGTDRGVLYVGSNAGVAWNGLKSVKEAPTGGTPEPIYYDGVMVRNLATFEEFAATIEAFSAPPEFGVCDGSASPYAGLILTQQPRTPFNLTYRTLVGNDIDGTDLGYKIHLVYGALASPTSRDNESTDATTTPIDLSWAITVMPQAISTFKPTAHMVIDSRKATSAHLTSLQNLLYGTSSTNPSMPTPNAVITLFAS
jgi:hypothetical protein